MLDPQDSTYTFLFNEFFSVASKTFSVSVLSTCIARILTDQLKWTWKTVPEQAQGAILETASSFTG